MMIARATASVARWTGRGNHVVAGDDGVSCAWIPEISFPASIAVGTDVAVAVGIVVTGLVCAVVERVVTVVVAAVVET